MSDITETNPVADAEEVEVADAEKVEVADAAVDTVVEEASAVTEELDGSADDDGAAEADAVADTDGADSTEEAEASAGAEEADAADGGPEESAGATTDDGTDETAVAEETDGDAVEAEEETPRRRRDSPYDRPGRWFVIHTQSGYENKVRSNLLARTQSMNMEERIFEVVIPLEDVVEFKNGKKVIVQKKVFPGYLLTRMHLDDDSWFVVRNTPGVTGFIGAGNKPSPLPRRDVETFLSAKEDGDEPSRKGRPRLEYTMGETVRVKEGPFADFSGEIVEINEDQAKVKVLVNIFGRETPVELEFSQVAKL